MKRRQVLTSQQQAIAEGLAGKFDIDVERIYFLNEDKPEEPWLSAESLITIARQSDEFQMIDESFDQYIAPLNQVVHRSTVITRAGRTYTSSGVATIGERADIEDHALAAGRAVRAALTAAGFNPLRPGGFVTLDLHLAAGAQAKAASSDEAQSRNADLRRIHAVAERKGLIKPLPGRKWDRRGYKDFLIEKYETPTAAGFDSLQRTSLINALEQLQDAVDDEFRDVA